MKVYVVQGSTGEYSSHIEWLVKAYRDEEKAKNWVVEASAIARQLKADYEADIIDRIDARHPMDPDFKMDYTGTNYTYFAVELED